MVICNKVQISRNFMHRKHIYFLLNMCFGAQKNRLISSFSVPTPYVLVGKKEKKIFIHSLLS